MVAFGLAGAYLCSAQETSTPPKPQVKVNMLNVCAPSPEEKQEIASALARVPAKPSFSPDFEVDRGRSVLDSGTNPLLGGNSAPMTSDTASADFGVSGAGTEGPVATCDRRQRLIGHHGCSDAGRGNAGQPRQVGAFWKAVGGAGALYWGGRRPASRPERVRAAVRLGVLPAIRLPQGTGSEGDGSGRTGESRQSGCGGEATGQEVRHYKSQVRLRILRLKPNSIFVI